MVSILGALSYLLIVKDPIQINEEGPLAADVN
jgi:hypothetical protein